MALVWEGVFCANFVPLAYKNRPYLGICGNSGEPSSYWYYYPCLLQSFPVYPLWKTSNLNVGSSSLSARTSHTNGLHKSNSLQITKLCHFCAPDLERTLVAMSERTGMSLSQVADEVLYVGLIEMQELPEHEEWGGGDRSEAAHHT